MCDTENNEGINDDDNCRLCGLQCFEVLSEKSSSSLNNINDYPCNMKAVIAFLHEQILGCKENDENTRPKVSLSNEFFKNQKFLDIRKPYYHLNKTSTDLPTYSIKPLKVFKPVNTVNFISIKTKEELDAMLADLLKCCEIAVNVEYYSIRSYLGFTWLLQISTTETNYFIDCLKLETQLHILNEVFMSNNILKIFYKGEDSVLRLQKDFGIFLTNMLDVYVIECSLQASRETELLKNSVFLFLDPKHTYLLLFIKNYLTNLLIELEKNKILRKITNKCKKICDEVYKKPQWNDISVFERLGSTKASCQEIHIIEQLLIWRDETAQTEDVALNFILPDNKIVKCAEELSKFGYSETFNKYCNPEFLVNRKVELNICEIIKTVKRNPTKKLCIAKCLSNRASTTSVFSEITGGFAKQKNYCLPSTELSSSKSKNISEKNVAPINSSNDKIHKQEVNKKNESLQAEQKNNLLLSIEKPSYSKSEKISGKKFASIDSSNDKIHKQEVIKKNKGLSTKINIEKPKQRQLLKILKPQLRFKDVINNSSQMWMPRIMEKPNRLVPLHLHLVKHGSKSRYCHPYKTELEHFCVPRSQLVPNTPIPFSKIEDTPLHFINTSKDLMSLSSELKNHSEIAVDLKYNKNRSYLGYTSLLLISTRNSDYIIDALSLRHQLQILNKIFTDPKILKVFHNSANKLLWLQKDLSLYVVNMFDVARTNMVFNKKILSLALLKYHICDIKYKKSLQIEIPGELKDWRVRPLPFKVKHYLRYETHCLLYIKDILSNQLCGSSNLLKRHYDDCTNLCKKVYQKPPFKINCYKNIFYKKHVKDKYAGHVIRIKVMKELNRLRHIIAQREDENPNDILSEKVLLKLVDSLTLDQGKILNMWHYDKKKKYVSKIKSIISSAKNMKVSPEKDNDYQYIYELENYLDEVIKSKVSDKKESSCNKGRPIITLGDFIPPDKIDKNTTNNTNNSDYSRDLNNGRKNAREDEIKTSFILVKGNRWDETRNIGHWLNQWIGKTWSRNYYVKELSSTTFLINLFLKEYKDIIWEKRHQIHYEEGAFIQNLLSYKDSKTQKSLSNIAKDLREKGLKVKIRELAIKIEDKWYELKSEVDGLQEISEEELRKRGVDTDL